MKSTIQSALIVALLGAIVAIPLVIETYRWSECRKVGHGRPYCLMKLMGI